MQSLMPLYLLHYYGDSQAENRNNMKTSSIIPDSFQYPGLGFQVYVEWVAMHHCCLEEFYFSLPLQQVYNSNYSSIGMMMPCL